MDDLNFDQRVAELGQLRDRLHRLEEDDYMTAYYKGYSSEGQTVDEIKDEISELRTQVEQLQNELDDE